MIHNIQMQIADRQVRMSMDLDLDNFCDAGIANCCQHGKPCEPEVCHALARILQPGDVAVDGGANVGFFSILMAALVGPTGHVYAFEPGGNNLPKLAGNLKLNGIENVEVIDKPLASRSGEKVTLYEHDNPGYNSRWPDLSKSVTAERLALTTSIDESCWIVDELYKPMPKLIKLDIEGAELSALKGAGLLIASCNPIIIAELNEATFDRAGTSIEELRAFLANFYYDAFQLFEDGNLPCFISRKTAIRPTKLNANVMFTTIEKVESLWPEVVI